MKKIKLSKKEIRQLKIDLPRLGKSFDLAWCDLEQDGKRHPIWWGWVSPDLVDPINAQLGMAGSKSYLKPCGRAKAKIL